MDAAAPIDKKNTAITQPVGEWRLREGGGISERFGGSAPGKRELSQRCELHSASKKDSIF